MTDFELDARARGGFVHDTWVIARRGLVHIRRVPEALADATFQPIMFTLLFGYVFGGAIAVQGGNYREFLMGGIFAQTVAFTCFGVAMALATDRKNGGVDRFRSLPMAKGSYLAGHSVANLLRSLLPILLMSITGLAIGWGIHKGIGDAAAAYGLLIGFSFAMIWVGVLLGSALSSPEAVQGTAFVVIFPLTFVASTFVPAERLPGVLQTIAEWNPVSTLAESLRLLFGNPHTPVAADGPWSLHHPALYTIIWIVAITLVCAPLSTKIFARSIAD